MSGNGSTSFRVRIGRVTPKRGQKVELLRAPPQDRQDAIRDSVRSMLAEFTSGVSGFAFVVWDSVGGSMCGYAQHDGAVPTALLPEYVKTRLLLRIATDWVKEDINA